MQNTYLRLLTLQDVPSLTEMLQNQADHLRPWEPTRSADYYSVPRQLQLAEQALEHYEAGGSVPFLITSGTDEILGRLTVSGITRGALQSCALGYWVRADSLRRGHATNAVALAVSFAFESLGLHRVQAETLPENTGSRRVLEKNGFREFGLAPQYLNIDGQWRDHLMYQILNKQHVDEP
ncbi:GNAT family N-acetyltransferase [Leucobacter viscericola]|uniref:GNAT family N-acetyltransferase n=1 Tax=Leucobacter viscericola TaxID=2714935 RepID=A0A6G7XEQ9_9MICO|nr:GNAT family protein [Leucobacter viscericola]QIK62858.1 GNAT family N-acetyltransferase [Leucobacter viscericola]